MSDSNDEQSSSDSSRPSRRPLRYRKLQEESDRVLAGFLPATNSVHRQTTIMSTEMHPKSPQSPFPPNLNSIALQPYICNPKPITPLDGAAQLPANLESLIREFCGREKTRNLPCARSLRSRSNKTSSPFRYEDAVTGIVLATSAYKYGQHQFLAVVHGRHEPAIVNYMQGAIGETNSRKLYSVWNGIPGWEKTPSVVKIFYEDSTTSSVLASPTVVKNSSTTITGGSTLGLSRRQAGKDAEEKIRLSLKRKRNEYEWEEEAEEDDSDAALSLRTRTRRPSNAQQHPRQSINSSISFGSTLISSIIASHKMTPMSTTNPTATTTNTRSSSPMSRQRPPVQVPEPEVASLTPHMQANTTFVFLAKELARPRIAKFANCDNITKLFNHARTAGLFRTWAEVEPLSCKVNMAVEEICVMKDIVEDFHQIVEAIQTDGCWNIYVAFNQCNDAAVLGHFVQARELRCGLGLQSFGTIAELILVARLLVFALAHEEQNRWKLSEGDVDDLARCGKVEPWLDAAPAL